MCYFSSARPCQTKKQLDCFKAIYYEFALSPNSHNLLQTNCMSRCPLECNSTIYSTSISTASYPTTFYENILLKNNSNIAALYSNATFNLPLGKNLIKLNIFLSVLGHTEIIESGSSDLKKLASDVGGSVGLATGAVAVAAVEAIVLAAKVGHVAWRRSKSKANPAKKPCVFDIENMPRTIDRNRNFQDITFL